MKITIERIVIIILIAVLALSTFKCGEYKEKFNAKALENQLLDSMVNAKNQIIYTQESVITSDREGFKAYVDSMMNYTKKQERRIKDVLAYIQSITKTEIKEVEVPYLDTLFMKQWEDSVKERCSKVIEYYEANMMPVPRDATDSTKDYKIDITVTRDNLLVNSIQIPDTQHISFNIIKGGFLKKDTYGKRHLFLGKRIEANVLHTNPLIKVVGQKSAVYIPPKKARWLEKTLLIGAGIFLGTKL